MSQMMSRKRIIQYQARDELRRCTNCRTRSCRRQCGWSGSAGGSRPSLAAGRRRIRRLVDSLVCRAAWLCLIQAQACAARVAFGHGRIVARGGQVGFFSRLLIPRSVRRAMHPGRAVKRAVTPKAVKRASRALHPVDNAVYSMQRSAATAIRSGSKRKAPVFRHGNCPVHHRSAEAAAKCRNL